MRRIVFTLILALLVTACGAKGPLYIPDKKYPQPGDKQNRDKSQTQDDTQSDQQDQNDQHPKDTNTR